MLLSLALCVGEEGGWEVGDDTDSREETLGVRPDRLSLGYHMGIGYFRVPILGWTWLISLYNH